MPKGGRHEKQLILREDQMLDRMKPSSTKKSAQADVFDVDFSVDALFKVTHVFPASFI